MTSNGTVERPDASVLVTAHNAAGSIGACLRSLAAQQLGGRRIELILVDDRSTDGTGAVAESLGIASLRTIRLTGAPPTGMTARQAAVDAGVRAARAAVVLITDADALVPEHWAHDLLAAIEGGSDLVAGGVDFVARASGTQVLSALQTVDACYYLTVCELLWRARLDAGLLFGNAGFRRSLYESLGGFAKIGFALTEDLAFARAALAAHARVTFAPRTRVSVSACGSSGELVRRGVRTSSGPPAPLAFALGGWALLLLLFMALALIGGSWGATLLGARYLAGVAFVATTLARSGRADLAGYAFVYEIATLWFGVRVLLARRADEGIEWGGVRYDRHGGARQNTVG
jgi:cellulose synthase/poly-beta-1,6-N-acetylglucosamine synthase-like glycosyltransferase